MPKFSEVRARQWIVSREKLAGLLEKQNWTPENLSLNTGIDAKTIYKLVNQKGNFASIIRKVASALGVKPDDLAPHPFGDSVCPTSIPVVAQATKPRTRILVIKIPVTEKTFEDSDVVEIIVSISRDAKTQGEIIVVDSERGSLILYLEMDEDDTLRVYGAFLKGKLDRHNIESITLLNAVLV